MFILNALLVVALGVNAFARPQMAGSFEVDGFVFDGPADRPPMRTLPNTSPTRTTPTTQVTQGPLRSSAIPATSTPIPGVEFTGCLNTCPVTPEYNPVCGSDNTVYNNPGALNCASFCGKSVSLNYYGPCSASGLRG